MTAQRKHELQRRYWHATGVVRWIGAHAAVTQYHPEPARKARWQAAVRFWNGVRRSVWAQLHPRPSPRPLVDSCLRELIRRESGGKVNAVNPTTGAYGLPQALPGYKMASAGPDWRTNPVTQIRWMVGYVADRWGGSCAALSQQKRFGWY
jgi:hypothetical protein